MGAGANIENIGLLKPWYQEMGAFADGVVDHTAETVEEDGALAAVNSIERGVQN